MYMIKLVIVLYKLQSLISHDTPCQGNEVFVVQQNITTPFWEALQSFVNNNIRLPPTALVVCFSITFCDLHADSNPVHSSRKTQRGISQLIIVLNSQPINDTRHKGRTR